MGTKAEIGKVYNITGTYGYDYDLEKYRIALYVNGNLVAENYNYSGEIKEPDNNTRMVIGANPSGTSVHNQIAKIKLHSARIYNKVLSKEERENNLKATKEW